MQVPEAAGRESIAADRADAAVASKMALDGLAHAWTFEPSSPSLTIRAIRAKSFLFGLRPAPPSAILRPLHARERWNGYFLFLPDGVLTPAHQFTLNRLRQLRGGLLAICASPQLTSVPSELLRQCDAVVWKGLSGYDFSAYAIALHEVSSVSPGADLLLLNDSVLGPFADLDAIVDTTPWDLTGFTAWSSFENHLQSYALFFRNVTPVVCTGLRSVLSPRVAFNHFQQVVNCQETRLARVASRTMTVGAQWFAGGPEARDPSLAWAAALLEADFPFLKRSLVAGKLAHRGDPERLVALIAQRGHPV